MSENYVSLNFPNIIALNVIWLGSFAAITLGVQLWKRYVGPAANRAPLSLVPTFGQG